MVPAHWFEVLCCPVCRGGLRQTTGQALFCTNCQALYPVVEGIPLLLTTMGDEVSRIVNDFYASQWRRDEQNRLQAKVLHEDLTDLGQRYIHENEARFLPVTSQPQRRPYFLDAAPGAQPRSQFGQDYDYHICIDFSLDGLIEARRLLGERAIVAVGSLLQLPLRAGVIQGALASHCLYHVAKEQQVEVMREVQRVLAPGSNWLIFYANPTSLENRLVALMRRILPVDRKPASSAPALYYHPLPIHTMRQGLENVFGQGACQVRSLRLFSRRLSRPAFRLPLLRSILYRLFTWAERALPASLGASWSTYVSYIACKP
jgi:uncharacterized protein YbaR (Trm112 family)